MTRVFILIGLIILIWGFCFGSAWQREKQIEYYEKRIETLESQVVTKTETITETEYITRTITVLKEVPVEVPVIERELIQLDYFETLEELEAWLAQDNTDKLMPSHPDFDCDDFAYALQRHAARDGYFISTEIIRQKGRNHMINSALISDEIYFIEPATDEVWFKCRRD